jgi:CRP-like cAMP-binding protein
MKYQEEIDKLRNQFDFKSNFLLSGLSQEYEDFVRSFCEPIIFKKGSKLFYEDGIPTGVFMLESGLAKKYKVVIGQQEQIFYVYAKGALLGYHALLSDERYQDSCEAIEDMQAQFISKDNFLRLIEELPNFKSDLIQNLAHEFGVLANIISVLAQKTQNVRLALYLLILESRYQNFKTDQSGITMSRLDLSNLIGVTRESLGRSLKEFKEKGLITIKSKVIYLQDHDELYEMLNVNKLNDKPISLK